MFGRIAYEEWRERPPARPGADRLAGAGACRAARSGPRPRCCSPSQREAAGDARGALGPLLAVADSLPDDRLAPLARQRAGDLYRSRLEDEDAALAQYEECLARYPRAWNAPEVRRVVERLRRDRPAF